MLSKINIKRVVLTLTIIMIASFAIAGAIAAIWGAKDGPFSIAGEIGNRPGQSIKTEKTFDAGNLENLSVKSVSENINIIPTESDEIKADFHGVYRGLKNSAPSLQAKQSGNNLDIWIKHKITIGISLDISFSQEDLKLDLYVPKTFTGNINSRTVSGDLEISDLSVGTFKHHSTSGDLSASNLHAKKAEFETISGLTDVDQFDGDLKFKSVSGDLNVGHSAFDNDANLRTTSGDLNLKLPEKSAFDIRFDTVSGNFDSEIPLSGGGTNSKRHIHSYTGDSNNQIDAKSVSGNLEIEKIER